MEDGKQIFVVDDDIEKEEEEEDVESLKKRISSHPLYALLIQTHLSCLQASLGLDQVGVVGTTNAADLNQQAAAITPSAASSSSELDRFMEAYCVTLSKLKQAMEEPVKETESFVDAMYVQLRELCEESPK